MLNQVKNRLKQNNIEIEIEDSVKKLIAKKGFDANYGARPLRRAIQSYVEDTISEAILDGIVQSGKKATVKVNEEETCIIE